MLSIGKMAKYCHTTIQTLRFYDQKGLLKPIYINPDNNYRYYKDDQIFHFMIIQYLQETGMTLEEIKKIMQTETTNLYSFWQKQEKRLKEIIAKEKQVLELAKFQQKQSLELNLLKNKLNKGIYVRKISTNIFSLPLNIVVTPDDLPDKTISLLDNKILKLGALPNLEYGFTFRAKNYKSLNEIHYLTTFKKINVVSKQTQEIKGNYLGISFMWDKDRYLFYLDHLLKVASTTYHLNNPIIIENSFPLNYNDRQLYNGKNTICELRTKL